MASLTLPEARVESPIPLALDPPASRSAAPDTALLTTIAAAGRELAHTVNNGLCLPLGVLDMLAVEPGISEDMRALIAAAREVLQRTAGRAQEFQAIARLADA
jgi:hypothetical protein